MNLKGNKLNGRLGELLALASTPSKNVKELSKVVNTLALVVIDIHMELMKREGQRETMAQIVFRSVVAPLLVGTALYLAFNLAPSLFKLIYTH